MHRKKPPLTHARGWNRQEALDPKILAIPGWMTNSELSFVHWYMRERYTGVGEAVELGCAFGRSTAATIAGLVTNVGARDQVLHVYDRMQFDWFLYHEYQKQPEYEEGKYQLGDSFEPIFWQHLRPWRDRLRLHAGDIAQAEWSGKPIEYLFIDIMKSWEAAKGVIRTFFPALIPQVSWVVHQDYKHPYSPQILLTMYRLRDYFEPLYSVNGDSSATVVFRCIRALDSESLERALADGLGELKSYSVAEVEAAFDHALAFIARSPVEERNLLMAARVVLFLDLIAERPDFLKAASTLVPLRDFAKDRLAGLLDEEVAAASNKYDLAQLKEQLDQERSYRLAIESSRAWRLVLRWWRFRNWLRGRPQGTNDDTGRRQPARP